MIRRAPTHPFSFLLRRYRTIVIGAPGFFSLTWKIVKGFIDARTQSKIEFFSNTARGKKRLLELIDGAQLPRDYGGSAPSVAEQAKSEEAGVKHRLVE